MIDKNFNLLKTLKTIVRWPRMFLTPLAIILVALVAYTSSVKIYRSSAIVLFESSFIPLEEYFTLSDKFESQPVTIVRSLLFGTPANQIVEAVWPEIKNDELARNSKIQQLRSLNGISLKFQRDNPQALSISYDSTDPKLSYKVVSATVNALIGYNQEITKRKLTTTAEFLDNEIKKTTSELAELEQKIIRVRSGLPASILEDRDQETAKIENLLDIKSLDRNVEDNLAKALRFDESLQELDSELEIAKKELEQLEGDLINKSYLDNVDDLEVILNASSDQEITRTSGLLFEKQQKLSELLSKGFLTAHPDIQSLQKEVDNLKQMKRKRLLEMQKSSNRETPEITQLKLEKLQLRKIEDKKAKIQALQDRIIATRAYEEKFKDKTITLDDKLKELSERKAMLQELENRRIVASHSFAQMTKRLEVIKREGRIDQNKFGISISVAEHPEVPKNNLPFAGLPIILVGITISLVILFSLAALMTLFDRSIYLASEATALTGLPVIGVIDGFISLEEQSKQKQRTQLALIIFLVATLFIITFFY